MNCTITYHLQANRLEERFHSRLKESLTTRLNGPNWIDQLPWVMLGICTAPKENLNASSMEMMYGAPLIVPGEFLLNMNSELDAKRYLTQLRDSMGQLHPVPMLTHVIYPGDKTFQLLIGGRQDTVSINRLKLAHLNIDSSFQVAQPPNRGHPRQITPILDKEKSPKN
uniref:Integrase catalytic domain-containing protein n=1 Tax=Octopus bimaculoides TaxID=37653 RepID=A0A0L8H7Q7_OCTBM